MKEYLIRDIKMSIVGPGCGTRVKTPTNPIEQDKKRLADGVYAMTQSHNRGTVRLVVQVVDTETGYVEERKVKLKMKRLHQSTIDRLFNVDVDIATVPLEELKLKFQRKGRPLDDEDIKFIIEAMEKYRDAIYEHQPDIWIENITSMLKVGNTDRVYLYPNSKHIPVSELFDMNKLKLRNTTDKRLNTTKLEDHIPEEVKEKLDDLID